MKKNFFQLVFFSFFLTSCQNDALEFFIPGLVVFIILIVKNLPKQKGYESDRTRIKKIKEERIENLEIEMIFVEGGAFVRETVCQPDVHMKDIYETRKQKITLDSFNIGKYLITQRHWIDVMGGNPSRFQKGYDYPVENVSWYDAQKFIRILNAVTGKKYRLPTWAEWEYAARGGTISRGYKYSGSNRIEDVGWFKGNSSRETHSVGEKQPNELGIYDMSGNLYEWCNDCYNEHYYYDDSPQNNPMGPSFGSKRVMCGGCWGSDESHCLVSNHFSNMPLTCQIDIGFRLVLDYP